MKVLVESRVWVTVPNKDDGKAKKAAGNKVVQALNAIKSEDSTVTLVVIATKE